MSFPHQPNNHWLYAHLVDGRDLDWPTQWVVSPRIPFVLNTPSALVSKRYFSQYPTDVSHSAPWANLGSDPALHGALLWGALSWSGDRWYVAILEQQGRYSLYEVSNYFDSDFKKLANNLLLNPSKHIQHVRVIEVGSTRKVVTHEMANTAGTDTTPDEFLVVQNLNGSSKQQIRRYPNPRSTAGAQTHEEMIAWCFNKQDMYCLVRRWQTFGSTITSEQMFIEYFKWNSNSYETPPRVIYRTPLINPNVFGQSSEEHWEVLQCPIYSKQFNQLLVPSAGIVLTQGEDATYNRIFNRVLRLNNESEQTNPTPLDLPNPSRQSDRYPLGVPVIAWTTDYYPGKIIVAVIRLNIRSEENEGFFQMNLDSSNWEQISPNPVLGNDAQAGSPIFTTQNFIPGPGCYAPYEASI